MTMRILMFGEDQVQRKRMSAPTAAQAISKLKKTARLLGHAVEEEAVSAYSRGCNRKRGRPQQSRGLLKSELAQLISSFPQHRAEFVIMWKTASRHDEARMLDYQKLHHRRDRLWVVDFTDSKADFFADGVAIPVELSPPEHQLFLSLVRRKWKFNLPYRELMAQLHHISNSLGAHSFKRGAANHVLRQMGPPARPLLPYLLKHANANADIPRNSRMYPDPILLGETSPALALTRLL